MADKLTTTAYDPPVELEGPNSGLSETVAARIWAKRATLFSQRVTSRDFSEQSEQCKRSWRATAADVLQLLLVELGFTGPAGPPRIADDDWTYCWNGDVASWEIIDDTGGAVALVMHHQDLTMLAAAPGMDRAIRSLMASLEGNVAALALPEIIALMDALPARPTKEAP